MRMKWVKNENENNWKRTGWEWKRQKIGKRIKKRYDENEMSKKWEWYQ